MKEMVALEKEELTLVGKTNGRAYNVLQETWFPSHFSDGSTGSPVATDITVKTTLKITYQILGNLQALC